MSKVYVISESRLKELLKAEIVYYALDGAIMLDDGRNKECIDNYIKFVEDLNNIDECVEKKFKEFKEFDV